MEDPENFDKVARTLIRPTRDTHQKDPLPSTLGRKNITAAVKYVSSDHDSDHEFIRKTSASDFNLDFDLELKWQRHIKQYNKQVDGNREPDTLVQKEHEELLLQLAAIRKKELEDQERHLNLMKKKKKSQHTPPAEKPVLKPSMRGGDTVAMSDTPIPVAISDGDDFDPVSFIPDDIYDELGQGPARSRSILTKIEYHHDPEREKHVESIIDEIAQKYNRERDVITHAHRRKIREMMMEPRTKNVKVVVEPDTGEIHLVPIWGNELDKVQKSVKKQIKEVTDRQKLREEIGEELLKVKELLHKLDPQAATSTKPTTDPKTHRDQSIESITLPPIDDEAFRRIDDNVDDAIISKRIQAIRDKYQSFSNQYSGAEFKKALEEYYAAPDLEDIGFSPNQPKHLGERVDYSTLNARASPKHVHDDVFEEAVLSNPLAPKGLDMNRSGKMFAIPEGHVTNKQLEEDVARGRRKALEMKRQGYTGDLSEFLHPSDRVFFDKDSNKIYTSRAKTSSPSQQQATGRPQDDIEPLYIVEEQAADFVDLLFSQGRAKGGIGQGSGDNSDEVQHSDGDGDGDPNGKSKEEDTGINLTTRFHTKKGLSKDTLEAHPIEYLNKFLMRVHPDLFVRDVYNVIDDKASLTLNKVSKVIRDQYGRETSRRTHLDPEPTQSYLTGEFTKPENIRYYQLQNHIIQTHNTEELSKLNVLIDYYKKIVALTKQEQSDPFAPHLSDSTTPKQLKMTFFIRPKKGSPFAKPTNLTLGSPIWSEDGKELRPSEVSVDRSEVPYVDGEVPHLRAVRVFFNPPKPVKDTYQTTINLITSLERTFVELLRGIDDEISEALIEKWRTDLQIILDAKIWSGNERRERTLIDKIFRVKKSDILNPNLEEDFAQSSYNYMHLFPHANAMTTSEHIKDTHPRYHLFNSLLVGGYVTFDPQLDLRTRVQSTQSLKAMIVEGYPFFDSHRWWSRKMTETELMKRQNMARYLGKQPGEEDPDGSMLRHNLGQDPDDQAVWPTTQQGEGVLIHFAIHLQPAGTPPSAMVVSSSHLLSRSYHNSKQNLEALTKIFSVDRDSQSQHIDEENRSNLLMDLFNKDSSHSHSDDVLTAKMYHDGLYDDVHGRDGASSDQDTPFYANINAQFLSPDKDDGDHRDEVRRPSLSLKFPSSLTDHCLMVMVPHNIKPEGFQDFLFSHAYVLLSEWEFHMKNYQGEFTQISHRYAQGGKQQPISLHQALTMPKNPKALEYISKHQPELFNLLKFYTSMQSLKYKAVDPRAERERQQEGSNANQAAPQQYQHQYPPNIGGREASSSQHTGANPADHVAHSSPPATTDPRLTAMYTALTTYEGLLQHSPHDPTLIQRHAEIKRAYDLLQLRSTMTHPSAQSQPQQQRQINEIFKRNTPTPYTDPYQVDGYDDMLRNAERRKPQPNRKARRQSIERRVLPSEKIIETMNKRKIEEKKEQLKRDVEQILIQRMKDKPKPPDPNNMNDMLRLHAKGSDYHRRKTAPIERGIYLKRLNEASALFEVRSDKM